MEEKREYLTKEKYNELSNELKDLKSNKRKEVAENLDYARGLGDLSENAEYHEAREEQANIEERISKLESILKSATVFEDRHGDHVMIGSTVTLEKVGSGEKKEYQIVGSEEADTLKGKISNRSPLGASILGKNKNDSFKFNCPSGTMTYKILDIK
ncbi:MAG: transcription elongation factor GreA [Minisyncoccia bacterium]